MRLSPLPPDRSPSPDSPDAVPDDMPEEYPEPREADFPEPAEQEPARDTPD